MNDSLSFALKTFFDYQMKGVWTVMPCMAISDANVEEMRVDVQPLIDGLYDDGTTERRPPLYSVPLQMPATNNSVIWVPVSEGDILLCVFSQRSLDNFKAGVGEFQEPSDYRRFDKRDAIAIPGIFPFKQAVTARRTIPSDPKSLSLTNNVGTPQEVTIQLTPSGDITMTSPTAISLNAPVLNLNGQAAILGPVAVAGTTEFVGAVTTKGIVSMEGAVAMTGVVTINGIPYLAHFHPATPPSSPSDFSGPVVV